MAGKFKSNKRNDKLWGLRIDASCIKDSRLTWNVDWFIHSFTYFTVRICPNESIPIRSRYAPNYKRSINVLPYLRTVIYERNSSQHWDMLALTQSAGVAGNLPTACFLCVCARGVGGGVDLLMSNLIFNTSYSFDKNA